MDICLTRKVDMPRAPHSCLLSFYLFGGSAFLCSGSRVNAGAATRKHEMMEEMEPTVAVASVPSSGVALVPSSGVEAVGAEEVSRKTNEAASGAGEERKIKHEQGDQNLAKAFTAAEDVRKPASALQLVEKVTNDYKEAAGQEVDGARGRHSSPPLPKYRVGDIVQYKFGYGDWDWVDAKVKGVHDSGHMTIAYALLYGVHGGGDIGPEHVGHGAKVVVLAQPEWETKVVDKGASPPEMIGKLAAFFTFRFPSDYAGLSKGIATQFMRAVTKDLGQLVECTPSTTLTKQQWANYLNVGIDSEEVDNIFRGADVVTFMQFAGNML